MSQQQQHVLITGATGFIATHIIDQLIKKGGYKITATTRDVSKAQNLYKTFPHYEGVVTFVSVPDFTVPGAFDDVFQKAEQPFDYVLHTASPLFVSDAKDVYKDAIAPGPEGIKNLYSAAKKYGGPQLKRIVQTSSVVTCYDPTIPADQPKVITERDWNPVTVEQAVASKNPGMAYFSTKIESEKVAWAFIENEKPSFDMVALLPVIVLGPNLNPVTKPEEIEQGAKGHVYSLIDGTYPTVEDAKYFFYTHIDVRDVARAHVDALTNKQASGKRIALVTSDPLTPQSVVNILNKRFPQLKGRLPKGGNSDVINPKGIIPEVVKSTRTKDYFGWDYRSLEESVVDIVDQILEQEKTWPKA